MKKIGLLVLILMLALGALGVGYGAWAKAAPISGTVYTGYSDAIFVNSAQMTGNNVCYATAAPAGDAHTLLVTVYNAYPGSTINDLPIEIKNYGTVPIHVTNVEYVSGPLATWSYSGLTDSPIVAGPALDGGYSNGTISFSLLSDPSVITENSTISFLAQVDYTVAVGP
jgi:hypothetical protein